MTSISRRTFARLGAATALAPYLPLRAQESGDRKLGIALLGLGDYATHQLAPALQETKHARLTGIVTGSPEKVPTWQEKYAIPDGNVYNYDNFDEIADNKDIDIVYVVTPTGLHDEFSIRAAKAGKHVISEKPMAPTVEDCTRMIEAAEKNDVTLQIGYRLHWEPYNLRLIEAMKTKEFGDWKSISATNASRMTNFTGLNKWRIGKELGIQGALYDLGVYCVQGQLYSAQARPLRVTANHSTERKDIFTEVPETYEWELEFEGGRKAAGMASYGKSGNWLKVETDQGMIELSPVYGYGGQKGSTPEGPMDFPHVNQQALQIDGQALAILKGEASKVPGEMGRRDIRVIRGIMEAADAGKPYEFGKFLY
ncbi:Gfo/Idh/MocA family protein [Haloferula sargassicola]|uniref:Glucose--fructose oxidoreductase n=1 Tax=Haloferula sargassicola TaxID=490096 RepID=A0ABP9UMM0_9BACT